MKVKGKRNRLQNHTSHQNITSLARILRGMSGQFYTWSWNFSKPYLTEYLPLAYFLYPIFWSFSIFALLDLNRPSSTRLVSLMHFLSIKLITYKKYIYNFSSSKATGKAFFGFKYQPIEKIDHSRTKMLK